MDYYATLCCIIVSQIWYSLYSLLDYACVLCLFCLHNGWPCGFITFFSISMATQDYCMWCACHSSNETYDIRDDSEELAVESKYSANICVPIARKTSACNEEFMRSFPAAIFDVLSENHEIVMWLWLWGLVSLSAAAWILYGSQVRKESLRRKLIWHTKSFV